MTTDILYQDYLAWCRAARREPFLREFARLTAEVGMQALCENAYGDVAVVAENASAVNKSAIHRIICGE